MNLMAKALSVAQSQNGVREVPVNSNRGPDVEKYLKSVGVGPGNAWCAAFTSWCIEAAGGKKGADYPHTAGTSAIWTWAQSRGPQYWLNPQDPTHSTLTIPAGALFLIYGKVGEVERVKHVGFVQSVRGGAIRTIEGNTNLSGSREGGGVYELERMISGIYRFVFYGL